MAVRRVTCMEYKVTIERPNNWGRYIEWRATLDAAEAMRETYNVISIEYSEHLLDY